MIVVVVVVAFLVVGVVGALLWRRSHANPQMTAARQEIANLRKSLKDAEKTRNQAVRVAEGYLKQTTKSHEKAVATAESRLRQLNDPKGRLLGSYHGVRLYERWIDTPHGSGPVEGTVASVDSQVSSRITATRLVTLGVFALAAKKKTGAIYLSIDNPVLASVVECPKEAQLKARQFAVQITNAGKNAAALEASRPGQIAEAEQALAVVRGDTSAVEAAQAELDRVQADEALLLPVKACQEALKEAETRLDQLTAKPGTAGTNTELGAA